MTGKFTYDCFAGGFRIHHTWRASGLRVASILPMRTPSPSLYGLYAALQERCYQVGTRSRDTTMMDLYGMDTGELSYPLSRSESVEGRSGA